MACLSLMKLKTIKPSWQATGYFNLLNTDNHVGSLYSIDDMMTILSIPSENKKIFCDLLQRGNHLREGEWIDEPELNSSNIWKCLMNYCSQTPPKKFQSLSELELKAVIEKVYGQNVTVDTQIDVKTQGMKRKRYIDLKATINNETFYIEFLGPQHFSDESIEKDIKRKQELEREAGYTIIEWPYWIQICERNVRIAFGDNLKGRGAIWGSFCFWKGVSDKVKQRICDLSSKFNAIHKDGIGYFYEIWEDKNGEIIKPAHPIIQLIKENKYDLNILLPANVEAEGKLFWLPKDLWYMV